ncbi:MAG TPA: amidohydrolase family protein [Candidatus Acidoferrales bacterium]|nr:amidohydrolase family protein [Candidatus Acidoferrales bacterium]
MTIDAHHHLWKYSAAEYGWISPEMRAIKRDFLPEDLEKLMHHFGIDGTVTVQARQTLEETRWLLELAHQHEVMRGVVGWVPLEQGAAVKQHLERLAADRKLRGVRHVIHDEPDDRYILRANFNEGMRALVAFGLRYDILIFEKHLPAAIEFVDRHPNQVFILDHIAKPRIKDRILSPWDRNIREMAKRRNVYCKLSGMVTEADHQHWTPAALQPYIDVVLQAFGPARLMYGSDWPVMLLAGEYAQWYGVVTNAIAKLSKPEQERIMGGTAVEAYRL